MPSFDERLQFSYGRIELLDIGTIQAMIPSCVGVQKAGSELDRRGADYIATLGSGRQLLIDVKARDRGCSSYWLNDEPELALERHSVCKSATHDGRIGWTLDSSKITDLVLFTFDPADTPYAYLLPFNHLRTAFIRFGKRWKEEYGPLAYQTTEGRYRSSCIFVPAGEVVNAVRDVCIGRAVLTC